MPKDTKSDAPCVLATGGAGYIGSHVVVELLMAGFKVVILDNFENSDRRTVANIPMIARGDVTLIEGDVRDARLVEKVLRVHQVDAVIHLAGKKAVAESVAQPLLYFRDNLVGAIALFEAMRLAKVSNLVFSSSATVYGVPKKLPVDETAPTCVSNPYGRTKLMIEDMVDDFALSWECLKAISLRYFNPVGAHASALIGENPTGIPNNLFPFVAQTAIGTQDKVNVFGGDYDTADGTGVRDFIHVVDLAKGHVRAIENLLTGQMPADQQHFRINLGTGRGYSVLEVIRAFSKASGRSIPYEISPRRPGDAAASIANPGLAADLLGWRANCDLDDMCRDHWAFQVRYNLTVAERERNIRPDAIPVGAHRAEPTVATQL